MGNSPKSIIYAFEDDTATAADANTEKQIKLPSERTRRRQVWELVTTASHYIIQPRNLLKLIAAAAFELPARCDLRRTLQNILSCNSKIK
jgi:hypothetical protein